jgi:antitoxin VapB
MSLNIKSPEADALVDELARLTGESKTRAVIAALRERLDRARRERDRQSLSQDLQAIGKRCAAHGRANALDHGEWLYDERGLPR